MKRLLIVSLVIFIFSFSLSFLHINFGIKDKNIPIVKNTKPKHSYNLISDAFDNNNYQNYSSSKASLPKKGEYSSEYFNPVTNEPLYFDASYGGGYACCEQSTFYLFVDKSQKLFWVEEYAADLNHTREDWFGPFSYNDNPDYQIQNEYRNFDEVLADYEYRKYPTNYGSLPIKFSSENKYSHPISKNLLEKIDRSTREYESITIYKDPGSKEFWVRYGTLNVDLIFWNWYGPFNLTT